MGIRVYHVGAPTAEEAAALLLGKMPDLADTEVRYAPMPGVVAEPLGIKRGDVKQWEVGEPARLSALTGTNL